MKCFSDIVICGLVLVSAFVTAGCEQEYKEDIAIDRQQVKTYGLVPDYASQTIEATGGLQAWMKVKELQVDCVVTFYKPDGGYYLTQHHYEISPWLNSVRISAQEPQGKFIWQLSDGQFGVLDGAERIDTLPKPICSRFAKAILDITTAPVRFLDELVMFTKGPGPVKMEGLWYYPIERLIPNETGTSSYWSKVVFYQNRDTSFVDMLWFAGGGTNGRKFLVVRGYDYREIEEKGVLVPTRIEIFRTDARGILQQRLVKIDCYSLKTTE